MTMVRGVTPVLFDAEFDNIADTIKSSLGKLKADGLLKAGDQLILTIGDSIGTSGNTNTLKVLILD
jgi:pyruvate kinase